ncbi:MAG: beta-hydroxyacyl-ACP dehydratase [Gemmatimonadota bacterium]|nr:beta-hydroxyacyl-ACP dehydratase [Gemmatimonadota bacterium]
MHHAHVDRIVSVEPGRCARALKCVSLRDEALGEHFPGNPVLPGVFLLEALAQTAGVLLWKSTGEHRLAVMASVDRARFVSFARPGDSLQLDVEIEEQTENNARIRGRASRDGADIAVARMTFWLVEPETLIAPLYAPAYRQMIATWLGEYPDTPNA